jgi:serine/threonine protein phosphatase PrpC
MPMRAAGNSDPGRVRENNEDRFHLDAERGIFVVVDGVGGQAGGETAAETALLQVRTRLERDSGSAEQRLREAITLANNEVHRLSRTNAEWTGMACVLTAAVVEDQRIVIGHVGDSRLYKLRAGAIKKLTHDHSPVGEREDAGELDEHEAMRHPRRNEVFRDIGSERHTPSDPDFVEIIHAAFEPDAALLLCSDGLSDVVTSQQIVSAIDAHAGDPEAVVQELIDCANRGGGKDNITVVYVEGPAFGRGRLASSAPGTARGRTRRVAIHSAVLLVGVAIGAAAMTLGRDWLDAFLPGEPVTAIAEPPRNPQTLVVQQAAAAAFATIGDAMASALPGDTVLVGPGEYREQLTMKTGVTVRSEVRHRAVLRLDDAAPTGPAVTAAGARNARLEGFQIVGDGKLSVGVLVRSGELELEDTRISGATEAGVDVWGGTTVTLRANEIIDNLGPGVRVRTDARPEILHNRIARNGRSPRPAPGVVLEAGAAPLVMGNIIVENGAQGIAGVSPPDRDDLLRHNVFAADTRTNAQGALGIVGGGNPGRR